MAKDRMTLVELMRKAGADGDVDFLREGLGPPFLQERGAERIKETQGN